jgi:hypothetical protein
MAFPTKSKEEKRSERLAAAPDARRPGLWRGARVCAAVLLLSNVAAAATGDFQKAFARRGCTQEDAPAVEIVLTDIGLTGSSDPSAPFLRIEIAWSNSAALVPSLLRLSPLRRPSGEAGRLARAELSEAGAEPVWLEGEVRIETVIAGKRLTGRIDVTAPDGRRLQQSFAADWIDGQAVCG